MDSGINLSNFEKTESTKLEEFFKELSLPSVKLESEKHILILGKNFDDVQNVFASICNFQRKTFFIGTGIYCKQCLIPSLDNDNSLQLFTIWILQDSDEYLQMFLKYVTEDILNNLIVLVVVDLENPLFLDEEIQHWIDFLNEMVEEKSNGCQMQLHNRLRQMVEQAYLTKEQTTFSQPDGQPPRSSFSFTSSGKTSAFLKSPTLSDQVGLPIILVIDNSSYASYFSTSSEMSLSVFREEAESVFLPRLRARALRLGAAVTLCLTEHRDNSILLHMIALCHSAMYNLRRSEQISELTRRASGDLQSLFLPFGCDTPDAVISKQRIFDSGSLPSSSTSSDSTSSSDPSSPPTSLISPEAYKAAFSVTNSLFRSEILPSALPAFSMPLEGNGAFTDSGVRKKGRMMEYPAPLSKDVPADEQTFLASLLATEAPSPPPPKNPKAFFEQMLSSSHNIRK